MTSPMQSMSTGSISVVGVEITVVFQLLAQFLG
jgi:hypothetical protein